MGSFGKEGTASPLAKSKSPHGLELSDPDPGPGYKSGSEEGEIEEE
jgi:hypothetical protein